MSKVSLLIIMLATPTTAFAQGIPTWNIDHYCTMRANKSGMKIPELLATCVEAERASLSELKDAWTGYTSSSREKCLKAADQHYADLQACIIAAEAMQHTATR